MSAIGIALKDPRQLEIMFWPSLKACHKLQIYAKSFCLYISVSSSCARLYLVSVNVPRLLAHRGYLELEGSTMPEQLLLFLPFAPFAPNICGKRC